MATAWTTAQILALAPDPSAAKSGQGLASARKWKSRGTDGRTAWGECQGSAKDPYQTEIDLGEPAFHCTCPSRKFPCKHSLGLFLLLAESPASFEGGPPPAWVAEWLSKREARAEKRAQREEAGSAPADPAAQAKRAAEREKKVQAGLRDLEGWLDDFVRQGLATAEARPRAFFETAAARLVDAQAPGIARRVRDLADLPASGAGWPDRLLERLARIHLLLEAFRREGDLSEDVRLEVRGLVGWTQSQPEVLEGESVRDAFRVAGQRTEEQDRLRVQRTWLLGRKTGTQALHLQFAPLGQPLGPELVAGTILDADLAFFPGLPPRRALVKQRRADPAPIDALPGAGSLAEALGGYAEALARNPWLERFPMALGAVAPFARAEGWGIRDAAGRALPVSARFAAGWRLLAISGGRPIALFGEWDGDAFLPLSALADGRFHAFAGGAT